MDKQVVPKISSKENTGFAVGFYQQVDYTPEMLAKVLTLKFPEELRQFNDLEALVADDFISGQRITHCHVVTDSSQVNGYSESFNLCIDPIMAIAGYSERQRTDIHLALTEAYSNAIFHAHRGGRLEDYNKRTPPSQEELESNWHKKIKIDALVSPSVFVMRVKDEGEGFDPSSIKPCETFACTGRGLLFLAASVSDKLFRKDKDGFYVSIVKYIRPVAEEKTA